MLRQRATSAALLVPPLILCLALGGPWIVAVVLLVATFASVELFRLLRAAGYPSLMLLGAVVAIAIVADVAGLGTRDGNGFLLTVVGLVLAAAGAFARPDPRDGLATWVMTVFGAVYVAGIGFVVRLGQVGPAPLDGSPLEMLGAERAWILVLLLGVWSYDTGAYLTGRRLGGARFLSHISPSKTYAGLVGGLVAATLVTAVLLAAIGRLDGASLLLGPLIAIAAQAGDLAESMLKRAAGAKDSGTLIPGHGGILDRVDSFLFAAPIATLYVSAVLG